MSEGTDLVGLWRFVGDLDQRLRAVERMVAHSGAAGVEVEPPPLPRAVELASPVVEQPPPGQPIKIARMIQPPPLPPWRQPVPVSPMPPPLQPARPRQSLEATIGLNWTGWVGAIVFVLGVLFFLKYAWDQGWIRPTPAMRVMLAIGTGMAISGLGEWMHRRRAKVLAAVLHGAGLAIVLASFFGAYALFDPPERVLGVGGAFLGVALTAGVGILIALHINAMVLAIIALIGAYLAPIVLNTGQDRSPQFLGYLGVLAAVALVLSHLKPAWGRIRILTWFVTAGLVGLWWMGDGSRYDHEALATIWTGIFFGAYLLEMILTLRRWDGQLGDTEGTEMSILSLLNTAAAGLMLRAVYPEASHDLMLGVIAVGVAGVHGAAAFLTRDRSFSIVSLLQATALLTIAVPLVTDRFVITIAWLVMAGVVAVMAWQLNVPAARGWAFVLLVLSIIRLAAFDGSLRGMVVTSAGSVTITQWTLMAWATAMLAHLIAWIRPGAPGRLPAIEERFARIIPASPLAPVQAGNVGIVEYAHPVAPVLDERPDPLGIVFTIIGTGLFIGSAAMTFHGTQLVLAWLIWLVPIILLAHLARPIGYFGHAAIVLAAVSLRWFLIDGVESVADNWSRPSTALTPLFNLIAFDGLFACALVVGLLVQLKRWPDLSRGLGMGALIVWIVLILFALVNIEALRAVDWLAVRGVAMRDPGIVKHVVMSVLWALTGFATVILGFRRDVPVLRYVALGLLAITLGKILLVDMAEVRAVWRILSFLAVGGLLLGVSYVYHRQMEAKREAEA